MPTLPQSRSCRVYTVEETLEKERIGNEQLDQVFSKWFDITSVSPIQQIEVSHLRKGNYAHQET